MHNIDMQDIIDHFFVALNLFRLESVARGDDVVRSQIALSLIRRKTLLADIAKNHESAGHRQDAVHRLCHLKSRSSDFEGVSELYKTNLTDYSWHPRLSNRINDQKLI